MIRSVRQRSERVEWATKSWTCASRHLLAQLEQLPYPLAWYFCMQRVLFRPACAR